jgi:hypothetical protein
MVCPGLSLLPSSGSAPEREAGQEATHKMWFNLDAPGSDRHWWKYNLDTAKAHRSVDGKWHHP